MKQKKNPEVIFRNIPDLTLFLDRDGVINRRLIDAYVTQYDEFEFLPDAKESIVEFRKYFSRIFIVTNQQGIGKGLMSADDLKTIHQRMLDEIQDKGGAIDHIYYCPNLKEEGSIMRKPNPGMALQARKDYPDIRFKRSVMVGDSLSDMQFGRKLGMKTVYISDDLQQVRQFYSLIDFRFDSLKEFATFLEKMVMTHSEKK